MQRLTNIPEEAVFEATARLLQARDAHGDKINRTDAVHVASIMREAAETIDPDLSPQAQPATAGCCPCAPDVSFEVRFAPSPECLAALNQTAPQLDPESEPLRGQERCDKFNSLYPVKSFIPFQGDTYQVTAPAHTVETGGTHPLCVVQLNGSRHVTLGALNCGF